MCIILIYGHMKEVIIIYLIIIYLASQMWLLGRILPILIGDLMLEDN